MSGACSPLQETGSFTLLYDEASQQQERSRLKREADKGQEDRPRWSTWGSSARVNNNNNNNTGTTGGTRRALSARSSFRL